MRFVIDTNNAIGVAGIAFFAGMGWGLGMWVMGRILSVIKI